MEEKFTINTKTFSLKRLKHILETKDLLPGRVILKENIDQQFNILESAGLKSMYDLLEAIKNKKRLANFAEENGIDIEYLTILKREAASYISKPARIKDIPGMDKELVGILEENGLKNSKEYWIKMFAKKNREKFAVDNNLNSDCLTELIMLCDVLRMAGVGPLFARILLDVGLDSATKFLSFTPEETFRIVTAYLADSDYANVKLGLKDMVYCFELAKELPVVDLEI